MSAVKVTAFEAENVKRIRAVELAPTPDGLTVIGGANGQGKTSVLDALAWALGGDRLKPSRAHREGSALPPRLRVELSNGIVVERSGKGSSLKVVDPSGNRAGQRLLDAVIEPLALDLPRFLGQTPKEKARTLLDAVGVGDRLADLERQEGELYAERTSVGQMERGKRAAGEEMRCHDGVPAEPLSAAELVEDLQAALARNAERGLARERLQAMEAEASRMAGERAELQARLSELSGRIAAHGAALAAAREGCDADGADEDTEALEASIAAVDEVNAKVRENQAREAALAEADGLKERYEGLTAEVERVRREKLALLEEAGLPLPELTVEDGELAYKGARWDCMSGSDQLKVATAIVRKLKPGCGFVLVDKLEQMDPVTLAEFGEWAEAEGLQVIGTRVSTGGECSVVIEDGKAVAPPAGEEAVAAGPAPATAWEWKE